MNIAIIDDIASDAEQLKRIITSYFENRQIPTEIRYFSSAEAFFDDYRPGNFQILFLDIYMDGITGMEAARRIRNQSDDCILVFVTTSSEFAVESYDVNAAYYLHARYIEIISDRVPVRVPLHSILYADTFRNAVCLHTDAGPLRSYLTFHKFEEQIRDCHNFLSCYRGCMVNMDRIQEATDDGFLLDNGETVQIRKRGSAAIRKAYLQYLFSSGEGKSLP